MAFEVGVEPAGDRSDVVVGNGHEFSAGHSNSRVARRRLASVGGVALVAKLKQGMLGGELCHHRARAVGGPVIRDNHLVARGLQSLAGQREQGLSERLRAIEGWDDDADFRCVWHGLLSPLNRTPRAAQSASPAFFR